MLLTTFNGTPIDEIIKKLPPVIEGIDAENVRRFEEFGTSDSREYRHRCVLCANYTCIDDSISNQGHRLIDLACVHRYFEGDYAAVREWNKKISWYARWKRIGKQPIARTRREKVKDEIRKDS